MLKYTYILKPDELVSKAEGKLREALESLPLIESISFETEIAPVPGGPAFIARLGTSRGQRTIIGEVKSQGQPRFARAAINQLLRLRQQYPNAYPIFVAPYISPDSANILSAQGVGYLDLAGNCLLSFDTIFIRIQGVPNPFPQRRDLKSIFSPKSSRILRVLLNSPPTPWKIESLRQQAGVSIGLVATVRKILLDREWATEDKAGLVLRRPRSILDEWSSDYSYRRNQIFEYYSIEGMSGLETKLGAFCGQRGIKFALTMFSGAARVAPHTRFNRVFAYIDDKLEDVRDQLDLKPVGSGPNIVILKPYDTGVFYGLKFYENLPVVSPVQLYLDLRSYKGRGEEAAEFLLKEVLEKIWSQGTTTASEK
jgi:hypothetical protein